MAQLAELSGRMTTARRPISRLLPAMLTVLGLLGAAPAIASAGVTGIETPALAPPAGFELSGTHGYAVEVTGVAAQAGSPADVVVRAATRTGSVTYHFPGVVEEGSIQAELGPYGQISVVFIPPQEA